VGNDGLFDEFADRLDPDERKGLFDHNLQHPDPGKPFKGYLCSLIRQPGQLCDAAYGSHLMDRFGNILYTIPSHLEEGDQVVVVDRLLEHRQLVLIEKDREKHVRKGHHLPQAVKRNGLRYVGRFGHRGLWCYRWKMQIPSLI